MRTRWFFGCALAASACYEVGELREPVQDAAGGAANQGTAGTAWGASSGTGGGGASNDATVQDAENDVDSEASPLDASSEPLVDASAGWKSCKALGYEGACVGTKTVLFYLGANDCGLQATDHCIVNQCTTDCATDYCSGGFACNSPEPAPDVCASWGAAGKCIDNVAIKQDGNTGNCLYKDCTELGSTCVASPSADCM